MTTEQRTKTAKTVVLKTKWRDMPLTSKQRDALQSALNNSNANVRKLVLGVSVDQSTIKFLIGINTAKDMKGLKGRLASMVRKELDESLRIPSRKLIIDDIITNDVPQDVVDSFGIPNLRGIAKSSII
jgi:cell division protein ZapA (FtsZ GTPase activity inhibitor)